MRLAQSGDTRAVVSRKDIVVVITSIIRQKYQLHGTCTSTDCTYNNPTMIQAVSYIEAVIGKSLGSALHCTVQSLVGVESGTCASASLISKGFLARAKSQDEEIHVIITV